MTKARQVVSWTLRHALLAVFVLAMAVRAAVVTYVAVRHDGYLFADDHQYVQLASDATAHATGAWDDYTRTLYRQNATLLLPMTVLFRVFGVHAWLGEVLVALAGALTALLVTRLALEIVTRRVAFLVGAGAALLPSQVFFSSLTLKDALVWAALATVALLLVFIRRTHGRHLLGLAVVLVVVLILLGFLRQHTLVVCLIAILLTSWLGDAQDRMWRVAAALVLLLVVPWAVGAGVAGKGLLHRADSLDLQRALGAQGAATALVTPAPSGDSSAGAALAAAARAASAKTAIALAQQRLEAAQRYAADNGPGHPSSAAQLTEAQVAVEAAQRDAAMAEAAASAAQKAAKPRAGLDSSFGNRSGSSAVDKNLRYLPKGLAVMVLFPYPWRPAPSAPLKLARAETLMWYPLLLLAVVGLGSMRRHARILAFPLLVTCGLAAMWALVEGNFGTAYRHRGEFVWAVFVLAAPGLSALHRRFTRARTDAHSTRSVELTGTSARQDLAVAPGAPSRAR